MLYLQKHPRHYGPSTGLRRFVLVTFIAVLSLPAAIIGGADTAAAQQVCAEGALVDGWCEVDASPAAPIVECAEFKDDSGCYTLVQPLGAGPGNPGVCPPNTQADPDLTPKMCRRRADPVIGSPTCQPDFTLEGDRCVRRTAPTCGPLGCEGRVIVDYTVNCVGEGVARVNLGSPQLINGAVITLTTVNGSAVVGADLPGGSPVVVQVTTTSSNDVIDISGPAAAPTCITATPAPAATAAAPQAPATPAPTPTPEEVPEVEPAEETTPPAEKETTEPQPTTIAEPTTTPTAIPDALPTPDAAEADEDCEANEARIGGQCLLPCPTASGFCYELTQGVASAVQMPEPPEPADKDDSLIIILAAIAGASVVLSVGVFSALTRRSPRPLSTQHF